MSTLEEENRANEAIRQARAAAEGSKGAQAAASVQEISESEQAKSAGLDEEAEVGSQDGEVREDPARPERCLALARRGADPGTNRGLVARRARSFC